MELEIKYKGKIVTQQDIDFIEKLISDNPSDSRRALSKKLCKAWNWVQPNGVLRDMFCRGFMLHLESAGYIKLPPRRFTPNNPFVNRKKPAKVEIDQTPIEARLSKIQPLEIRQIRCTPYEKLFNGLIAQYHYLGYCHPVGEHLKYIVYIEGRPIACFAWSSAPRHIGSRDKFIGWSPAIRKKNIHLIVYNSRFLILPWIHLSFLASHLLGRIAKIVSADWERVYNHPVYFLETFVDKEKFKGTCYRAANWIYLGDTTGRGKNDQTHKPNRSIKAVLGYPLSKNFRELLCHV
ncbi:MAG TPA: DUF4338 domain-containing protein [Candidatus Moranbacteria bacterium]|nr:DUF4338 domain-containing protein [Candidatus Moranbacteria bacterium]